MKSILLPILLVLVTSSANGGFWPEFRGPLANGHAPDASVPLQWSPVENIRWKIPVVGKAWSSPIVADGRIFVTTAAEKGSSLSLQAMAYSLEEGLPIWTREIFLTETAHFHQKNSEASPTPVYSDGKLYCHFGHHGTACLDAETGETVWRQESLRYDSVHGNGGSPILHDGRLIFSCDGRENPFVVALDAADGSILWKVPREVEVSRTFSFSTPLAIEVAGESQIVIPGSGAVMAYRPGDGKELWRCRYGEGYSVVPRPLYRDGRIYVCSGFGRASLFAIRVGGSGDVTDTHIEWQVDRSIPRESSPIIVGDLLYVNDDMGVITCIDLATGQEVYRDRLDGQGGYSSSPVHASDHLFFHNGDGVTTVVKPGRTFLKVGENNLGEYGLSSFAVVDDGFIVRTESSLLRIGK